MYLLILGIRFKTDQQRTYLMMLMQCFLVFFFSSDFLYKSMSGNSFLQVNAIQMGTHNIRLYKEVDKKYTGCNLKTMELLDFVLIGICAVIRSNTVYQMFLKYQPLNLAFLPLNCMNTAIFR